MIGHIAAREMRSLFLSPLAWTILAVVEFILGLLFLVQVQQYEGIQMQLSMMENPLGVTELVIVPLFATAAVLMLLVMPLLTMRLISEERRAGTLPLLFSAPVSMTEIVLGKYLGILGFLGVMVLLLALMPLSLLFAGTLDPGLLGANLLGLSLMLAAFAAAGLYLSSTTAQPTIAAISAFGLLLLLWIIELVGRGSGDNPDSTLFSHLSLQRHYQALLRGVFDTSDVIYFGLFILLFVVLTIRRLDADRLQH